MSLAIGLVLAVLAVHLVNMPAMAAECHEVPQPDGTVKTICEDEPGGGGPVGGDDDDTGGGSETPQTCELDGREIPCRSEFGTWDGFCYVQLANPPIPKGEPEWEGNDDGVILECNPYSCLGGVTPCPDRSHDWAPNPPADVGPTPEELARRAVAAMQLTTGAIGSTPPSSATAPGSVGAIGLPIWLWIASTAENAVGPITRSASDGGLSVTATGTLDSVEWVLIDANGTTRGSITCDGANAAGTPYDGRDSAEPSPTCGFGPDMNSTSGALTLTGTAHWTVEWRGGGQAGQIEVTPPSRSAQVRIGELQMLIQD